MIALKDLEVSRVVSPDDDMNIGEASGWYFPTGESALHQIHRALEAAGSPAVRSILDLPSGYGRVLRWLRASFPDAKITACDLNTKGAEFCARTFGATAKPSSTELDSLDLGERFDLIWCGSLFTHLSEDRWKQLLSFFVRHLQEGGVLVFSAHGRQAREFLRQRQAMYALSEAKFESVLRDAYETGFGYVNYDDRYPTYGISLSLPSWVMDVLTRESALGICSFVESGWGNHHDIYAVVKRAGLFPGSREQDPTMATGRLRSLERALRDREQHLERIFRSRGWRALSIYYRLKGRLLGHRKEA